VSFARDFTVDRPAWEPLAHRLLLVLLCSAFIQGGLMKLADFGAAQAEMVHFGVPFPALSATAAIMTELVAPILVILGLLRTLGCLWLAGFTLFATAVANRFWELPPGHDRFISAAGLFEHLSLVAAFCLVALFDRWSAR